MVAAAPSPLASSVEKTNGAKLCRLIIDGGTAALRNIFDRHHPPAKLADDLKACRATLSKPLSRRNLPNFQWDKLFPPDSSLPDSNTFDITLLFFLLTNICGLSPPPTGWYSKPPPSDLSLEANIARIRFFRNELYGHVPTTDVDTKTFLDVWEEISVVLVALGLDQAEVDRLKAEPCGAEPCWEEMSKILKSEQDIKMQMGSIHLALSDITEKVKKDRLNLMETREIVADVRGILRGGALENLERLERKLDSIMQKASSCNPQDDSG